MIQFSFENIKVPNLDTQILQRWIRRTVDSYRLKVGNISYTFCNDEKIIEVNRRFLHHDYYTDIITFDYSTEKIVSGDLLISLDTVASNAEKFNVRFEEELHRVIIHGVLHLCGEDDKTDEAQTHMTKAENKALELLHSLTSSH